MSHHAYEAFGLTVRSNRPLAALREAPAAEDADVVVDFAEGHPPEVEEAAATTTERTGSHSTHRCRDGGWLFRLASHGGERAWTMQVSGDGRRIELRWRGPIELADIAALVEVTALPAALALRGVPLLHGCSISAGDGSAFLVLGDSGAGKSSVAAAAVSAGHALLADDIAALAPADEGVLVQPGGVRLRMNEDTAVALGWQLDDLGSVFVEPALSPKRFALLSVEAGSLRPQPCRVGAIFGLAGRGGHAHSIERLAPAASLKLLLRNTYGNSTTDARVRAGLLPFWARAARELPVFSVAPAEGFASLPSLVDALADAPAMLPPP